MNQFQESRAEKRLLSSCLYLQSNGLFHPLGLKYICNCSVQKFRKKEHMSQ